VKTVVRDTAIVIAIALGLILGLEVLLRLLAPQELAGIKVDGAHFSRPDRTLGMRYVPGAVWRFSHPEYNVVYSINSDGFRDAKQRSPQKEAGTVRVLLLGDSFTFGQGVDYEQTWPVLAERELERQGLAVDLVKAGMQGLDTRSELILMRRLVNRYEVDAVVVGFLINDLYSNIPYTPPSEMQAPYPKLEEVQKTMFRQERTNRKFHLLTLGRRIATATDAGYMALYLAAPSGEYLRVPLSHSAQRQLAITDTLLIQMAAYCDSLGKPLVVFSMPQQFQVMYARNGRTDKAIDVAYYDRHFAELASTRGFEWVPALDALVRAEKTSGHDMFYRLDGHFTPAGHAVAADVFTEQVIPRILDRTSPQRPETVSPKTSANGMYGRRERRALSAYQQGTDQQ
jgi:lysophospholipase L1-like esterase